jgi:hypothetical protein
MHADLGCRAWLGAAQEGMFCARARQTNRQSCLQHAPASPARHQAGAGGWARRPSAQPAHPARAPAVTRTGRAADAAPGTPPSPAAVTPARCCQSAAISSGARARGLQSHHHRPRIPGPAGAAPSGLPRTSCGWLAGGLVPRCAGQALRRTMPAPSRPPGRPATCGGPARWLHLPTRRRCASMDDLRGASPDLTCQHPSLHRSA